MSRSLTSRSADLTRLVEAGYEISIQAGHLVMEHVPYVDEEGHVGYGALVSELTLAGDVTTRPNTHVVMFRGRTPCDQYARPLNRIINGSGHRVLAEGLEIDHTFSSKPEQGYGDYYDKMVTYVAMLSGPAQVIDPDSTARTYRVVESVEGDSPFHYEDTASSRAGLGVVNQKLETDRMAIVGLGGTGGFVLDLVAKTPIREIHLFDGDRFLQHNAFRAPGAAGIDDLTGGPAKVAYWAGVYDKMRTGVIPHPYYIDDSNIEELVSMDFVFVAIDDGPSRELIVKALEAAGVSYIDVGMGIVENDGALSGIIRVSTSTPAHPASGTERLSFGEGGPENEYDRNIQVADLNALNAALAVIKWKKLKGFYHDLEGEHFAAYALSGNNIVNEDRE
jgi:hypothetical protein